MQKLFNSYGIIELAKENESLAFMLGKAAAMLFKRKDSDNKIIIGKALPETDNSIEKALIEGINSEGTKEVLIGNVHSSAVPVYVKEKQTNGGIMILFSEKEKFGFRFYNGNGYEITDEQMNKIEYLLAEYENNLE